MEDRGDLDPAPPTRHTPAAAAAPSEAGLGGPGPVRDPAQRDTENAVPRGWGCWLPRTRSSAAAGPPGPCAAGLAGRRPGGTSRPWSADWPVRIPNGDTEGSTASWLASGLRSQRRPCGRSSRPAVSIPADAGPGRPGHNSCTPKPRRSWRATSSRSTCLTALRSMSWPWSSTRPGASASSGRPASHRALDSPAGPQPPHGSRRAGGSG